MTALIDHIKRQLRSTFPQAQEIDVRVKRDHEHYVSNIHVHVPGKVMHAEKKASNPWLAVEAAHGAITRQVQRWKERR